MKRNIIVAKKAIPPSLCEEIIELGKSKLSKGGVGSNEVGAVINKKVRNSEVCFLMVVYLILIYINLY